MQHLLALLAILFMIATPAAADRLPTTVLPEHYTLWFAPDFQKDNFRGRETIRVQIAEPTTSITLSASEIEFRQVRVTAGGKSQEAKVSLDEKAETATLTVPQELSAGSATIDIEFVGILNDKLRGFYLSEANGREYAVTQMEATDARRAFPSFDEPAFKAVFEISVMADEGDTVISNGAEISDTPGPEPGKHTVTFAPTQKMSSYLVAMLVGDFVCREGTSDGTALRVCSTPDKKELTAFALEAAQHQLAFYNDYYGIKYPFGKLDIVGVPDFAAGAMENAGAITFREQYLLADPERASLSVKKRIAAIMSHEIAHQWFGNLVTMKWWDDIWLNEGFATWMANKPLAVWHPEWRVELDDVDASQRALALDALRSTRAIRTNVETPEQINEVFDAIAYQKSAAMLRMIESYVGEEVFRKSVASYLEKYAFANAAAEDFWDEVTRVSGKPVDKIMASYVDQPGVPVLSVSSRCQGSTTEVRLRQERFIGTPGATPATPQTWTLPVCLRGSKDAAVTCELMSQADQTLTLPSCGERVFINPGSHGYYFSQYEPRALATFTTGAGDLEASERLGLLGDEWWIVRAGRHDIDGFVDLTASLADDPTSAVAESVADRLSYTGEYLVEERQQPRFQTWIRETFGPALERLGLPGESAEDADRQSLRAAYVRLLGIAGDSPDVQRRARDLAIGYLSDPESLDPTLAPDVLHVAALNGDSSLYDQYVAQLEQTTSEPQQYYRYFDALSYFRDPALVQRTLEFAMSGKVRTQDTGSLIGDLLANPWSRDATWTFTKQHWPTLMKRLGVFQGIPSIVGALGGFCSEAAAADIKTFFASHQVAAVERTLQQSIERVESCAALHTRQSPVLTKWLERAGTGRTASRP
ncbi:MAG: M1 family peptidase [Luteitalea sp.]|nr:M1 family peptidase [Luteitalea sp.]